MQTLIETRRREWIEGSAAYFAAHDAFASCQGVVYTILAMSPAQLHEHKRSESDWLDVDTSFSETFDEDIKAGMVCYVRYHTVSDDATRIPGQIAAVTEKAAAYLCPVYARPATEAEAMVQARINRAVSGKQDATSQRFTRNVTRLGVAGRMHRAA